MEKKMLKTITQYYVSYGTIKTDKIKGTDDDGYDENYDVGHEPGMSKKLPQIVQAENLIEAIQKVDNYLRETQLATKYNITAITLDRSPKSMLT